MRKGASEAGGVLRTAVLFAGLLLSLSHTGFSAESGAGPVRSEHTEVRLVTGPGGLRAGQPLEVALHMKMDPHWHTYWRNPGDSGLATRLSWTLPPGFEAGPVLWPVPSLLEQPPLRSYGYENEVYLLTVIQVPEKLPEPAPVRLEVKVDWLECRVDCLPGQARMALELDPAGPEVPEDPARQLLFEQIRSRIPDGPLKAGFRLRDESLELHFPRSKLPAPDGKIYFFPYDGNLIQHAAAQPVSGDRETLHISVPLSGIRQSPMDEVKGVVADVSGINGRGVRIRAFPEFPAATSGVSEDMTFWSAVVFALLGGLILNLMPCVLPVLSLKVLSFIEHGSGGSRHAWKHGIAFTAGVLFSFQVLAGLLIGLRGAGHQIGWGFQLQSPAMLVFLALLFLTLALNLLGVFEIGTSLTRFAGIGGKGCRGTFLSGILAVLVATPCTAPFMGAALGFSLSLPPAQAILIFSALGLGMALPYLILSASPGLLRFVPRPGVWMVRLKQLLAVPLMLTVLWLLWVLALSTHTRAVIGVLAGLLLLSAGLILYGKSRVNGSGRLFCLSLVMMAVATGLSFSAPGFPAGPGSRETGKRETGLPWETFSEARLSEIRAAGRPVFVNFTAAWCLSCQVNDRVAFHDSSVIRVFREKGIHALKADWTNRDAEISRALNAYGRSSVPFYVFYPGSGGDPTVLSELLTPGMVLEAVGAEKSRKA